MKINIVLSMNNFHLPTPSFNFYLRKKKETLFLGSILLPRLNEDSPERNETTLYKSGSRK